VTDNAVASAYRPMQGQALHCRGACPCPHCRRKVRLSQ